LLLDEAINGNDATTDPKQDPNHQKEGRRTQRSIKEQAT